MSAFIMNMLLFGLWSFLFRKRLNPRDNGSKLYILIVSIQLVVFMAVSPVVSDAKVYAQHAAMDSYGNFEPGWVLFSRFVWWIWPDPKSLILVTGAVLVTAFSVYVWFNSKNLALSFLVYICFGVWGLSFYVLRQSLALALVLVSYELLRRDKAMWFFIVVGLAVCFHQTAALALLLFPLSRFERKPVYHLFLLFIGFLLLVLGPWIIDLLASVFRNGASYPRTDLAGLKYFFILLTALLFSDYFGKEMRNDLAMHSVELSCVLQVLSFGFAYFSRAIIYHSVAIAVTVPNALASMRGSEKVLATIVVVLALEAFYFLTDCQFPDVDSWVFTLPQHGWIFSS